MAMCMNLNNTFVVHFHIISSKKLTRGENNWTVLNGNTNICNIPYLKYVNMVLLYKYLHFQYSNIPNTEMKRIDKIL